MCKNIPEFPFLISVFFSDECSLELVVELFGVVAMELASVAAEEVGALSMIANDCVCFLAVPNCHFGS